MSTNKVPAFETQLRPELIANKGTVRLKYHAWVGQQQSISIKNSDRLTGRISQLKCSPGKEKTSESPINLEAFIQNYSTKL